MSDTFFELPVKVSLVGGREWRGTCQGLRASCTFSAERAGQKAVAAALTASGKITSHVDPAKIVITKTAEGQLVGRYFL